MRQAKDPSEHFIFLLLNIFFVVRGLKQTNKKKNGSTPKKSPPGKKKKKKKKNRRIKKKKKKKVVKPREHRWSSVCRVFPFSRPPPFNFIHPTGQPGEAATLAVVFLYLFFLTTELLKMCAQCYFFYFLRNRQISFHDFVAAGKKNQKFQKEKNSFCIFFSWPPLTHTHTQWQ